MSRRSHGESGPVGRGTPEYRIWAGMRNRCLNKNNASFARYGGRGIGVSLRWARFENFIADMGRRPTPRHSLDRIDWNRGYFPGNVRWATPTTQARNRQDRHPLTIDGETRYLVEWAKVVGVPVWLIWQRIYRYEWLPATAVFTPAGPKQVCKNGHPLTGPTVRLEGKSRRCTLCKKAYDARYRRGLLVPEDGAGESAVGGDE